MTKKGSWFAVLKRVFSLNSREKLINESETKGTKEKKKKKKKGLGKFRRGETHSLIPLFREPSSIEKILGDAERESHKVAFKPSSPSEKPKPLLLPPPRDASPCVATPIVASPIPCAASPKTSPPRASTPPRGVASPKAFPPRASSPPRVSSPKTFPPRASSPPRIAHCDKVISNTTEPILKDPGASATKIQAAYRGYTARRSFRSLRGLVRLQGVVRGQNVKRQTTNAMKRMQFLVRVQTQIQSRRIQMLENQALRCQAQYRSEKDVESTLGKWTISQTSEAGNPENWDDSVLTKEERETRVQKKVEAIMKRERAMAYAYSHQLLKSTPKSTYANFVDIRAAGFPWRWNWLEQQLSLVDPPESQSVKSVQLTPQRPLSEYMKRSPFLPSTNHKQCRSSYYRQHNLELDSVEALTPRSTKSALALKQAQTPSRILRVGTSSSASRYSRPPRSVSGSTFDTPLKDDDSLTSCPNFSVPGYMAPTVSAKAKAKANSDPKERVLGSPAGEAKRRLSFPLTAGRGSLFSSSQRGSNRDQSVENMSVGSTVSSSPVVGGRKPFNRFV